MDFHTNMKMCQRSNFVTITWYDIFATLVHTVRLAVILTIPPLPPSCLALIDSGGGIFSMCRASRQLRRTIFRSLPHIFVVFCYVYHSHAYT